MRRLLHAILLMLVAAGFPAPATAQHVQQFSIIGPIQSLRLDAAGGPLRGGMIKVNGIEVLIPANTLVRFPTKFIPLAEVFAQNLANPAESGLAMEDASPPKGALEVSIAGNIFPTGYRAGLIAIAQNSLFAGSGMISAISASGDISLVIPGMAGALPIKLADPTGRFGGAAFAGMDPRFTVDADNPSVTAMTGFPMCVRPMPGKCVMANRPLLGGVPRKLFVLGASPLPNIAPGITIPGCASCNPALEAPLLPGDMIDFVGVMAHDGSFVQAFAITANLGIYTEPGAPMSYVRIEGSLVGTIGPELGIIQETQDRFRLEGMTTDPTRPLSIYAVDRNPGTGAETLRFLSVVATAKLPYGRFRQILNKRAGVLKRAGVTMGATRELTVRIESFPTLDGAPKPEGAGNYTAPVDEFIFPENSQGGDPLVPLNFECLAFLQLGSGKWDPARPDVVGRLNPWPGDVAAPGPVTCGP